MDLTYVRKFETLWECVRDTLRKTGESTRTSVLRKGMTMIIVTLRSRKGAEWTLETTPRKLPTVKSNAKAFGYKIIKIEKTGETK